MTAISGLNHLTNNNCRRSSNRNQVKAVTFTLFQSNSRKMKMTFLKTSTRRSQQKRRKSLILRYLIKIASSTSRTEVLTILLPHSQQNPMKLMDQISKIWFTNRGTYSFSIPNKTLLTSSFKISQHYSKHRISIYRCHSIMLRQHIYWPPTFLICHRNWKESRQQQMDLLNKIWFKVSIV